MFNQIFSSIKKEFSGKNAKEITARIANYHRIQSSPGFRAAAEFCNEKLKDYKIPYSKIHKYPATGEKCFWGCPVPKEWSIEHASLELLEPKKYARTLCQFRDNPCSIIQRSKATPKEGLKGEIVILPRNLTEKEIESYNVKGKFVLTDEPNLKKLREIVVKKYGSLGIIYDLVTEFPPLRTRANFPTARRYTSFWYGKKGNEGDALGFVLSAEQGEFIRNLVEKLSREQNEMVKKIILKAKIDAKFKNGTMEVVDFCIPGETTEKEILAVAHLCHPKPSAVDNASGCAVLIETARTLIQLIQEGKLRKPKRTIRFLLMAEFTGTYCYLASNEDKIDKISAGINLDMVGSDQKYGGRTIQNIGSHAASPSFVDDVLSTIFNKSVKEAENFTETTTDVAISYSNDLAFSGGSDHYILGYPDIGIGTPMISQWPDRYYHTGEDTVEKISPEIMNVIGYLTATYCYFLANADSTDILWICKEVGDKARLRIINYGKDYTNKVISNLKSKEKKEREKYIAKIITNLRSKFDFRCQIELKRLDSIRKLLLETNDETQLNEMIEKEKEALEKITTIEFNRVKTSLEEICKSMKIEIKKNKPVTQNKEGKNIIPIRVFRGPITGLSLSDLSYNDEKAYREIAHKYPEMMQTLTSLIFWIDGKRSVKEIAELIEAEYDKTNIPFIKSVLSYYERHGLIKIKKNE